MNSPFRYPGGKFRARKHIMPMIPPHEGYVEPFCGGASIFFAKAKVRENALNDLDHEVINTLRVIRDDVESLIGLLGDLPANKGLHGFFKNQYKPSTHVEQAFRWFYLNRTSYSGIMKHGNCYWGYGDKYSMRPGKWPRMLRDVSAKLQEVRLTSFDFEDVLDELPDGFFAFVDPPYWSQGQDKLYSCAFSLDDHKRLAQCLKRNARRIDFLLTYNDCDEVRELYDWALHSNHSWTYSIARTDDQTKGQEWVGQGSRTLGTELFVRNYGDLAPVAA